MCGIRNGMKTTIDGAGRVVVPRRIRERAGWAAGTRLSVHWRDGRVELEPEPAEVELERRGGVLVAVAEEEAPPLTQEDVRRTIGRVRRREE